MSKPFKKDAITDSDLVNMLTQIDLYFKQCNMINDADMMKDCYLLAKDDFLNKYRWISEEEYNASLERFKFEWTKKLFNLDCFNNNTSHISLKQ